MSWESSLPFLNMRLSYINCILEVKRQPLFFYYFRGFFLQLKYN